MAVTQTDVVWRYSQGPAGAGGGAGNPAGSLGGGISADVWPGLGVQNDLFDEITALQFLSAPFNTYTRYRCVFLCNLSTTSDWLDVRLWVTGNQASGTPGQVYPNLSVGVAGTHQLVGSATTPAVTAPSLAFSTAATYATGVVVGTIPAGRCVAVWLRQFVTNYTTPPVDVVEQAVWFGGGTRE